MIDKLLWFRENKDRSLETDLAWAIKRHLARTGRLPNTIEVPQSRLDEFESLDFSKDGLCSLKVIVGKSLDDKYFQVFYGPNNDEVATVWMK